MEQYQKHGNIEKAALAAGMHRNTASKYLKTNELPSQTKSPRDWLTRPDPFAKDWPEIVARLKDAPELEAKTLFDDLCRRHPKRYEAGQLRTFQRRVKRWRGQHGPEKELYFAQEHRPGEAMQTDFTYADALGVTIGGEAFAHLLCHSVLPYSNWGSLTVCHSESMSALRRGVQTAVFKLGRRPQYHQTDNSTAATHDLRTGKRGFNEEYEGLMRHLGMDPRTIQVGKKEQNGDVEALNGALKRRLKQHLLLRQSPDFESVEAYETWLWEAQEQSNELRRRRLKEDLAAMRPLNASRLAEHTEHRVRVTVGSTIRFKGHTYSVPSRLKREIVVLHLYEDRVEVVYGGEVQLCCDRLRGSSKRRIDYRHLIGPLVRKPGAFARYKYREEMFPTPTFRQAYDRLSASCSAWDADLEYLRILNLAATTMESQVEGALCELSDAVPLYDLVLELAAPPEPEVPELPVLPVDLSEYDALLEMTS